MNVLASVRGWARLVGALGALLLAAAPGLARAGWDRAETNRFVVFGEGDPETVKAYAVKLTIYDQILRIMNKVPQDRPEPQKLEVYLVRGYEGLRRAEPRAGQNIAGFYSTSPGGVYAVAELIHGSDFGTDTTLFHEYAHHFMLENFPAAYPTWFVEGWAEYFSTVDIKPDAITVGGYNRARVSWLENASWMPISTLLKKGTGQMSGEEMAIFYPQSWALVHYFKDEPERAAQLDKALKAIAGGADPVKAMEAATGQPAAALSQQLRGYKKIREFRISPKAVDMTPKVEMTSLPPSADELLLESLRLRDAKPGKPDNGLLGLVRKRARDFPGDRFAELTLARAEFVYGDVPAGEAIVNRRLAANPKDADVLELAGEGQVLAGERDPAHRAERFRAARPLLTKAYGLNPDDPRTLFNFARSRTIEPDYPNENDLNALFAARTLAPAAPELSIAMGEALIRKGRRDEAAKVLAAVANSPHGGAAGVRARALIAGKSESEAREAEAIAEKTKKFD